MSVVQVVSQQSARSPLVMSLLRFWVLKCLQFNVFLELGMSLELLMILPMLPLFHSSIISAPLPRRFPGGPPCPAYLRNLVFEVCQSSGCRLPVGRGRRTAGCGTKWVQASGGHFSISSSRVICVVLFLTLFIYCKRFFRLPRFCWPCLLCPSWFSAPWVRRHHKSVSDPSGPAGLEVCDLLPRFPASGFPPSSLRYPFPVAVFLFPHLRRFSSGSWKIPSFIGPCVGSELREELGVFTYDLDRIRWLGLHGLRWPRVLPECLRIRSHVTGPIILILHAGGIRWVIHVLCLDLCHQAGHCSMLCS